MNNVNSPADFKEKLQEVMEAIYQLFELSKEQPLAPVSKDGVIRYMEEYGKTGFQVSGQYDRPSEFLQSLLDIIRANYEPVVLGTFFLNSNLSFLYDEIPESPFRLGYVSLTAGADRDFSTFWQDDVVPYIAQCGYTVGEATAIYAVASTGAENYGMEFTECIASTLHSGFSVEEATDLLAACADETVTAPRKPIHTGYCLDKAMGNRTRLSLWLFIRPNGVVIQ